MMLRIGITFVIIVAVIPLAIADQCNCRDLRKCLEKYRMADNMGNVTCEQKCSTTELFGEKASDVRQSFKKKRAQNQIGSLKEAKCLVDQTNFCTDPGGKRTTSPVTAKNGAAKVAKTGSNVFETIPQLKTFKSCVETCVQNRHGRMPNNIDSCGSEIGCTLDKNALDAALGVCKGINVDHTKEQAVKQEICETMRTALGKSTADMPCTEE